MSTDYYPQRKRISKAERRQVYEKYGLVVEQNKPVQFYFEKEI